MAPGIAWDHLVSKDKMNILDPMVGSGTCVTIARYLGHDAYGIDTDPLATTISSAWSSNVDATLIELMAGKILDKARITYKRLNTNSAFPKGCDEVTQMFIKFWFDLKNRKQLTALSLHIAKIKDQPAKNILWTAFSRMIITKSYGVSLAMDISHSRPHKVYTKAPCNAFDIFLKSVKEVISKAPFADKDLHHLPTANIINGDSRQMPYQSNFFDLIITSPPYLNAIDYLRASKMSLVWMGHSVDTIKIVRRNNIGSELGTIESDRPHIMDAAIKIGKLKDLPARERGFTFRYIEDMDKILMEMSRVLKTDGKAVLVVGNSTLKNVYISNSEAIISLASNYGLKLVTKIEREIPDNKRYLPSPKNGQSANAIMNRMKNEVIIELKKTAIAV